jgi:hypothetical protein
MKRSLTAATTVVTLFAALVGPARLAAQQEHNNRLPHYWVIDLGTMGGAFSDALGINSKGWVTGLSTLPGDASLHALLWRKGIRASSNR